MRQAFGVWSRRVIRRRRGIRPIPTRGLPPGVREGAEHRSENAVRTLLTLIEEPDHVCWRYRGAAFAPALERRGWRIEAVPLARGIVPFLRQLCAVIRADAVLVQRRLLPWWKLRLLRRSAKALFFDLDDAVFYRDSNSPRGAESRSRGARFRALVRQADGVFVGNHFLAQQARRFAPPARVHYLPTCIDPARYQPAVGARADQEVRLAWIGSRSTVESLHLVRPALAAASRRVPGLKLHVICDVFPDLPGVEVVPIRWSAATEAEELARCDIGISWLPEHPWSRGKCGLKVLQYMAAGLPVVANAYGVHPDLVAHDQDGLVAPTPEAWAEAVAALAADAVRRRRLGQAGRLRVETGFNTARWAATLTDVICAELPQTRSQRPRRFGAQSPDLAVR